MSNRMKAFKCTAVTDSRHSPYLSALAHHKIVGIWPSAMCIRSDWHEWILERQDSEFELCVVNDKHGVLFWKLGYELDCFKFFNPHINILRPVSVWVRDVNEDHWWSVE